MLITCLKFKQINKMKNKMKERYRVLKITEIGKKEEYVVQEFKEKLSSWYWLLMLLILIPFVGWFFLIDAYENNKFKKNFWEDLEDFSSLKEAKKYIENDCKLDMGEKVVLEITK